MIIKFPLNERLLRRLLIESGGNIGPVTVGIATEICAAASSNDVALLESWDLGRISLNIPSATGRTPCTPQSVPCVRKVSTIYCHVMLM